MGCFDSLMIPCPKCGAAVEFQSKADECLLKSYTPEDVPAVIAADLAGEVWPCRACGALVLLEVVVTMMPRVVEGPVGNPMVREYGVRL